MGTSTWGNSNSSASEQVPGTSVHTTLHFEHLLYSLVVIVTVFFLPFSFHHSSICTNIIQYSTIQHNTSQSNIILYYTLPPEHNRRVRPHENNTARTLYSYTILDVHQVDHPIQADVLLDQTACHSTRTNTPMHGNRVEANAKIFNSFPPHTDRTPAANPQLIHPSEVPLIN